MLEPAERLSEMRAALAQAPTAVALGGGGSLGSFEMGVLRFLYDVLGVSPAVVCGASAGSLSAVQLAHGDGERRAVDELEEVWRGLRENGDMWRAEPWLESLLAQRPWASELRQRMTSAGGSHVHIAVHLVDTLVRHGPDVRDSVAALRQAMGAESLLSLDPVRELLARRLDDTRLRSSGITLRMATVALEPGELRYVTETGAVVDRHNQPLDLDPVALVDAVVASCSIPLVFPPVRLGDEHCVDGGVRDMLPLHMARNCLGQAQGPSGPSEREAQGHTFAISALPLGVDRAGPFEDAGLAQVWRRVSGGIGADELLHRTIDPPGGLGRDVTVVLPEMRVHNPLTVDPELIGVSIDYGFMRAADVVLDAGEEQRRITTGIARARMALRETAGAPVPGPFGGPQPVTEASAGSSEELRSHLGDLVARRQESGLPLPDGLRRSVG